ncbi:hypothetical protein XENTR_v10016510 [Xenopus tropicalis]|nr:hypothetical protein XENTR_v10016510 [Xenopus tropicalis]
MKRKGSEPENQESKRIKGTEDQPTALKTKLPEGFFETEETSSAKHAAEKAPSLKLLAGDYEDDDEVEGEEYENVNEASTSLQKPAEIPLPPPTSSADRLPADFFESKMPLVSHSGSVLKADIQEKIVERKDNTAEALPEGFFDDPEADAKVRKVDAPKDQMDKEWEEFQKEIRQVNSVSDAIVAEEDEEGRLDRQIDEIDEQIECYRRVEHLRDLKDTLQDAKMEVLKSKSSKKWQEEIGSDDEETLPSLLYKNWRDKGAFL